MKERKIRYALRAHRRRFGLSQKELATLLGFSSAAHVSHIEQGKRDPSFATAFACAAIFGAPLCELFPNTTMDVKDGLKERAEALCSKVRLSGALHAAHKAGLLDTVPSTGFHAPIDHGE